MLVLVVLVFVVLIWVVLISVVLILVVLIVRPVKSASQVSQSRHLLTCPTLMRQLSQSYQVIEDGLQMARARLAPFRLGLH